MFSILFVMFEGRGAELRSLFCETGFDVMQVLARLVRKVVLAVDYHSII